MTQNKQVTTKRVFRKLEDLNIIDNFLFQQMLSDEENGEEFARILLRTFLGKEIRNVKIVPQKSILGIDTDKHGIRMDAYIQEISDDINSNLADAEILSDIYDIEPNNEYEKDSLPQRMRYYHGLIDTQLLSAGSGYKNLPNVVIIIILPYDPFNKKRMVYTVQNHCVEDTTVPYNDGARKIFLYTKGTEGKPSQSLKDMLKYIQESKESNVTNPDIASLQKLVSKVKRKKEVSINYMKSWEYEEMIQKQAFESGFSEGQDAGFNDGFNDGFNNGLNSGSDKATKRINQLTILLTEAGRSEDIIKAARDKEYQEKLFEEFGL